MLATFGPGPSQLQRERDRWCRVPLQVPDFSRSSWRAADAERV
jgi:hypothetical protein